MKEGPLNIVSLDNGETELRVQIARLEKQVRILQVVLRLLLAWKLVAGSFRG